MSTKLHMSETLHFEMILTTYTQAAQAISLCHRHNAQKDCMRHTITFRILKLCSWDLESLDSESSGYQTSAKNREE